MKNLIVRNAPNGFQYAIEVLLALDNGRQSKNFAYLRCGEFLEPGN